MLRLGVIGYGRRISHIVNNYLRVIEPALKIVGVVDPDEEMVRSLLPKSDKQDVQFYRTLDEMMRKGKLDGLAIGTRCNLHTPYAVEAAKYNIPLYLEKPVAISMKQAIDLERAFENSQTPVVVSFPLRVSPLCRLAHRHITNGEIGKPEHILATNYVNYGTVYFEEEYRNFEITQGLFVQKATHDFDYMSFLMGSNIIKVAACWTRGRIFGGKKPAGLRCSKCNETKTCMESPANREINKSSNSLSDHKCVFGIDCGTPEDGMNEDSSSALVEFKSGAHGVYTQVFYTRRDAVARGAVISGYNATLSFDWYQKQGRIVHHHKPSTEIINEGSNTSEHFGGDIELAKDFINIVTGKGKTRTDIWCGIQSVYACLAAKESAETGKFVTIRQVGQ